MNKQKMRKLITLQNGNCVVSGHCVETGEEYTTPEFPRQAWIDYKNGGYLQDAFSMLKAEEREFILTGVSPNGWNRIFPPQEDA